MKNKKKNQEQKAGAWHWVLIVAIIVGVAAAAFWGGMLYWQGDGSDDKLSQGAESALGDDDDQDDLSRNSSSVNSSSEQDQDDDQQPVTSWKTFVNSDYDYQVKYPPGASLGFMEDQFAQDAGLPNGKACVTISTEYGYVIIAGYDTAAYFLICGHSGVGNEYQPLTENVTIYSSPYTADGFYKSNEVTGAYDDFLVVSTDNHYKFEYGIRPGFNTGDSSNSKQGVKSELYQILDTVEAL